MEDYTGLTRAITYSCLAPQSTCRSRSGNYIRSFAHVPAPPVLREPEEGRKLKQHIQQTAIMCVETLHQYQNRGLNPDQAREAIQEIIVPI